MDKIFETLKVTSAPTTSVYTPSNMTTTTTTTTKFHQNSSSNDLRRSPNNYTTKKRSNNGRSEYNNKSTTLFVRNCSKGQITELRRFFKDTPPSANQHQRVPSNSSPIDILFKNQKSTPIGQQTCTTRNGRRTPTSNINRGRENYTPPNVSPPNVGGNYAGPKFSESPSPRSLPLPPSHWLQANHDLIAMLGTQQKMLLHQSPTALKIQS